ncbi:hypothetical protein FOZ61_009242 [Perkinsus olseni]|uniref:HP domain-containing protein n=1 Tax=Perkinsus olseni TaxID=32597 RepID=A0A7J6M5N1_PEROL|nr:hypothetical protein FOL46_000184 [Perkinsus olseni]KAF4666804.1 hypothetical protein FOZ61_009242 [Perkinsus olseni]
MGKSKGNKKKQQQQREGSESAVTEEPVDEVKGDDSPLEYLDVDAGTEGKEEALPTEDARVEESHDGTAVVSPAEAAATDKPAEDAITSSEEAQPTTTLPSSEAFTQQAAVDTAVPTTPVQRQEEPLDDSQLTTPQTKVNPYSPQASAAASPLDASEVVVDRPAEVGSSKAPYVQTPSTAAVEASPADDQTRFKWKVQNTGYLQSSLRASLSTDYTTIRASGADAPVADKRTFDDPNKVKYPSEQLLGLAENLPAGVNPTKREAYLSEEDFTTVFGKGSRDFYSMPVWKQRTAKKAVGLF